MRKYFATLPDYGRISRQETLDIDSSEPRFWLAKSEKLTFNRFIIARKANTKDEFCWLVVQVWKEDYQKILDGILPFAEVICERAEEFGKVIRCNADGLSITTLKRSKCKLEDFLPTKERI